MNKILLTLAVLVNYVYTTHIEEDWTLWTKLGKIVIFPFWIIRCVYVIAASPVLALGYYWEKTAVYAQIQDGKLRSMVAMDQFMEEFKEMRDFNKKQ